jgi:hypothetical protein
VLVTIETSRLKRVEASILGPDSKFESVHLVGPQLLSCGVIRLYKAGDFEGPGGPEDKAKMQAQANPGSDEVRDNIRQRPNEG